MDFSSTLVTNSSGLEENFKAASLELKANSLSSCFRTPIDGLPAKTQCTSNKHYRCPVLAVLSYHYVRFYINLKLVRFAQSSDTMFPLCGRYRQDLAIYSDMFQSCSSIVRVWYEIFLTLFNVPVTREDIALNVLTALFGGWPTHLSSANNMSNSICTFAHQ